MLSANDVRAQFIDFFVKKHGHTFVPSASVVPLDDPTLMFTNAGMNQFKDVFLGVGSRPYKRAVNSQKCIRASGKHNDLEDVGRDTYHHTFFEMLGNWSFGDYYKAEAIRWAWELLTQVWGLDKSRLHVTVFGGDAALNLEPDVEAAALWASETDIDPSHIHRFGTKDNFWMMGETGPCGPCTEIHIDRTPDRSGGRLVNAGDYRVMEIWNLVFIQYNRDEAGVLTSLPAKHVDTGMGFERLCAVLQGKDSNYDTDVFAPIMAAIAQLTGQTYTAKLDDQKDTGFRVIADHVRTLAFAITDGALPSNKGRGSVLRSILRRAVRFGWQTFGQREPFIHKLVPALVEHMGGAFPELKMNPDRVAEVIRGEEADFLKTIEKGLTLFMDASETLAKARDQLEAALASLKAGEVKANIQKRLEEIRDAFASGELKASLKSKFDEVRQAAASGQIGADLLRKLQEIRDGLRELPAAKVFGLYTTYGFPPDLTRQMAQERGLTIDESDFEKKMKEHEEISRAQTAARQVAMQVNTPLPATDDRPKWLGAAAKGMILGWIDNNAFLHQGKLLFDKDGIGATVGLVLDRTCFYAEAGGQVGDQGTIRTPTGVFSVANTVKLGNAVVHVGQVADGHLEVGQEAQLSVSPEREFTRKNHTATHLLHWALHKVLGQHVEQRGSAVSPHKLTFDFSHHAALSPDEKREIERLVNEKIYEDQEVHWRELPIAEAKKLPGVKAFFGDKYGDEVRIVEIGDGFSREFCGGTHLDRTGQAGFFKIIGEEATGKGIRRITALTGREAVAHVQQIDQVMQELLERFRCQPSDLPDRIDKLRDEIKKLQHQHKKAAAADLAGTVDKMLAEAPMVGRAKIVVGALHEGVADEAVRTQIDRIKQMAGSCVVILGWPVGADKATLMAAVSDDLTGKIQAGKLIGLITPIVGGKGGGRPGMAQAGGKEPAKLGEALDLALQKAKEQLAG